MTRSFTLILLIIISLNSLLAQTTVDCTAGPENINFCYDSGVIEEFIFTSSDGSPLNLVVNSGNVENGWDEFIVIDSNGTELTPPDFYGNAGDLSGLSYQSSGDTITVQVTPDGSVSCQSSTAINPIDITVSCATCVNPQVSFQLIDDCINAPQFFVEADITDLGSATDLDVTDNQGSPAQTVSATGVVSFGPYPNGTVVELAVVNNQDANCQVNSQEFTQDVCTTTLVDCAAGPESINFCYDSGVNEEFTFVSSDGSPLNLVVNSGNVENNFDEFIVIDSNGTELTPPDFYGNAGDLSGLSYQSSGDTITVQVTPDGSVSCQSSTGINPIDITVSCATCVNPQASFQLIDDCINAPQFFVEANITDLGSATDLDITDNQGSPAQTVSTTGVVSFGPYPNGTIVELSVVNNQDVNCQVNSQEFTQDVCTTTVVDCSVGPESINFCYDSGVNEEFTFVSSDGSPLNLVVNSGNVENNFDEFIVIDSNGTELTPPDFYGNAGDLSGLSYQSSGDTIIVQVTPDGSISCQSSTGINPIDITVSCATCVNPQVNFQLIDDCINAPQFFVEANITDLGSATDLDITDNQGSPAQTVSTTGVVSFGPYPNGTIVELTVLNNQDVNCQVNSQEFTQDVCTTTLVDCAVGPENINFCYDSGVDEEFTFVSSDGSPLNLIVNSGNVENNFDEFIVIDSNGTELTPPDFYGNGGDLSGLSYQSSGDTIIVQITPDGSVSCQSSAGINPIDITVSCATCVNPQVSYDVVSNCDSGNEEFFVDVNILDLGSATSLDITNNQGDPLQNVASTGTFTYGPYTNGTIINFTVENVDDVNCTLTSSDLTQIACPPDNDTCEDATVATINPDNFCTTLNSGTLFEATGSAVPVSCAGPVVQDVWFEFTATATTINSTVIDSGTVGISQAIYENTCDNLTEIYCSEEFNNFGDSPSIVAENLTIGETYYIRVFTDVVSNQNFELCLTTPQFDEDNSNCDISIPFCSPTDDAGNPQPLIFPNGYFYLNETVAETGPDYGCLFTQPNPAWYYLQVQDSGDLAFEIVQNTAFDPNGNPIGEELDVDFIAYGPFTDVESCDQLTAANTVDCSYSAAAVEQFNIPNAQAGEIYVVLITNFRQPPGYISLGQTNAADPGSGSTNCNIVLQSQITACSGDNVILTATDETADQYQWLVFDETIEDFAPISGEDTPSLTVTESGLYQILTLNGTEVSTEEFTVDFVPEPENNLPEEISICSNETITLDGTVTNVADFDDINYQWFFNGNEITGQDQPIIDISQPGNYSLEVSTVTENIDANGNDLTCVTNFDILVNDANFSVDLGENQEFCPDDTTEIPTITALITDADPAEASYLWNTNETTASISVTETGVYEVTVTINGCQVTESVTYTFAEEPVFDLGEDQNLCEGETTILDATVSNPADFDSVSYQWSDANGTIAGETSSTLEVNAQGTYSVDITTTTSTEDGEIFTCTTTDSLIISGAVFSVNLGEPQTFCDAGPQTITAGVEGADASNATYLWNTNETTPSISVNETGVYEVTVTIDGCPVTENVAYTFNESPVIALGPDTETCDLNMFPLDATPSNLGENSATYEWTYNGELVENDGPVLNPDDFGFGTYEVNVYFDSPECNTTDSITFSQRNIGVNITSDDVDNLFCINETVTFNATLENAEMAEADFEWFVNEQLQSSMTSTLENYEITSNQPNQTVRVEVSVGTECFVSEELSFSLYAIDNCVISQGLSPNEDGDNDNLDLRFLDDRSNIISFDVFNRYGQRVYGKADYRDEFVGQSDNGNMLETGTYFYVIKFENEDPVYGRVHKGWIYINREQ